MVKQNTTKDDHLYLCLERWETKLVFRVNIYLLHRSSSLLSMHTCTRTHTHTCTLYCNTYMLEIRKLKPRKMEILYQGYIIF